MSHIFTDVTCLILSQKQHCTYKENNTLTKIKAFIIVVYIISDNVALEKDKLNYTSVTLHFSKRIQFITYLSVKNKKGFSISEREKLAESLNYFL